MPKCVVDSMLSAKFFTINDCEYSSVFLAGISVAPLF